MRLIHLLFITLWLAACSQSEDRFVLRGTVPGALDSTEVELRGNSRDLRWSGYIVDGKFELTGNMPVASLCHLSMYDKNARMKKGLELENIKSVEANIFVENGNLVFTSPHIDSLPHSFWLYDNRKESNYTLKGSASHNVFDSYRRKTMDLQYRIRHEELAGLDGKHKPDLKALGAMKKKLRQETREFIASNRNLPVNLYLAESLEMEPFTYTQADLDDMTALFEGYEDTLPALRGFRETYAKASAYVQGTLFAGGMVFTPKGDTLDLRTVVKPGSYTFIDFWASWCSPCRASFPHLRKLYEAYGKKMAFVSVSVDKNTGDWNRALKEEKLPWPQFCATFSFVRNMKHMYNFYSVPNFLLIDPQGRIIFSGHDSGELEMKLEEIK